MANVRGRTVWQKGKGKVETVNLALDLGYLQLTLAGGSRQAGGKVGLELNMEKGASKAFLGWAAAGNRY